MATKAKSKSRSKARSSDDRDYRESSDSRRSGGFSRNGVHVKPDLSNPRVARITIEIDWEELISRVARKMGKTIRSKRSAAASGARRSRRASTSDR